MRDAMLSHGVQKNDVIAAVISNSVDAMVICLAALSIGAMWTSASCDLGVAAVVERFGQVKPRIVFADDGYVYGGKTIGLYGRIEEWAGRLEEMEGVGLESVVVVPYCGIGGDVGRIKRGKMLGEFLGSGTGRPLEFEYLPFDHSSFILYSSGTVWWASDPFDDPGNANWSTDGSAKVHSPFRWRMYKPNLISKIGV
jgi:acetoacetyl-CoA synthetase